VKVGILVVIGAGGGVGATPGVRIKGAVAGLIAPIG
jgi:hypothetical protein